MKTRPRVAAWLLRQFVGGPMRDSVIGDIEEQFARGGSSTWYWRQVLPAILFGLKADLCERPFAVIGSVILTSAVSIVWVELTSSFYGVLYQWLSPSIDSSFVLFEFLVPFGGGTCLTWCLLAALAGRVTARLTDRNRAVLIGVLLTQITLSLWLTRDFWLYGAFTTTVSARLWVLNYLWAATCLVGMPLSTLVGGRWFPGQPLGLRPDS